MTKDEKYVRKLCPELYITQSTFPNDMMFYVVHIVYIEKGKPFICYIEWNHMHPEKTWKQIRKHLDNFIMRKFGQ